MLHCMMVGSILGARLGASAFEGDVAWAR